MAAPSPSKPSGSILQDPLKALFSSKADASILHLRKVLSSGTGVDSTLTLVGYTCALLSSQLPTVQALEGKVLSSLSSSSKPHNTSGLQTSLKTFAAMCSEFRTFTRLWGVLGTYALAKYTYLHPPEDSVLRAIAWGQTASLGAYNIFENGYFLAMKGVSKGWTVPQIKKWAFTSLRFFQAYVALEFLRLYRVRQLKIARRQAEGAGGKGLDVKAIKEDEAWLKSAQLNVAFAPLTVHWLTEGGIFSDAVASAIMTFVGLVKFRASWIEA
jgi:hypothetical protein